jgi:hypothetical protein
MLTVSVKDIQKIGQIRELLLGCSTEEAVDGVFKLFDITDLPVRTMLLRHTMQIQEVFDVPYDESVSDEDAYKEELEFFLDGKWRDLV